MTVESQLQIIVVCILTERTYATYYKGGIVGEEPVFVRLVFGYEEETDVWYWDVTDKIGVND